MAWPTTATARSTSSTGSASVFTVDTTQQGGDEHRRLGARLARRRRPQAHFESPSLLALEGGALYVGDTLYVRKIDLRVGDGDEPAGARRRRRACSTASLGDGTGHLFVATGTDFAIRRVDLGERQRCRRRRTRRRRQRQRRRRRRSGALLQSRCTSPSPPRARSTSATTTTPRCARSTCRRPACRRSSARLEGRRRRRHRPHGRDLFRRRSPPTTPARIFLVESAANAIRKWSLDQHAVTTLAGRAGFPGVTRRHRQRGAVRPARRRLRRRRRALRGRPEQLHGPQGRDRRPAPSPPSPGSAKSRARADGSRQRRPLRRAGRHRLRRRRPRLRLRSHRLRHPPHRPGHRHRRHAGRHARRERLRRHARQRGALHLARGDDLRRRLLCTSLDLRSATLHVRKIDVVDAGSVSTIVDEHARRSRHRGRRRRQRLRRPTAPSATPVSSRSAAAGR